VEVVTEVVPVGHSAATAVGAATEARAEEAAGAVAEQARAAAAVYFGSGAQWLHGRRERV
jgi:hypothetical protein